ncbi:probable E3 ubiquitin-protein ligase ARI5 [Hordeum vulgare subsp. vulgare]|uniref:probable E3 ubiquitin-protein ligase ARI5 n=1 Tax=Hordeum vulgare subsp. vulgare TaxID=112509 RepID=UPI001D1A40C7|nr:probable E3 ubiquitin-protein ligase ARI5 [Hordeum vulgare subsp. vulgare]
MSDAEETKVCAALVTYVVLTEDEVLRRQAEDMAGVAEVLSIPAAFAAFLLRRYKWMPSNLQDDWFSDDRRVRDAAGLPADCAAPVVATALSPRPLVCAICFRRYPAGATRSASCSSHFYCNNCWRGYVGAAVGDGPRCLSLRCPDPACSAAVVRGLVDAVAGAADRERYARFALRSYVEESGGRIKWCPGAGCSLAVEFVGCARYDATDVFCKCRHGFCWSCGEEAHRPVSCGTVHAWLAKNKSDSESANWVLANTKLCPKCRRAIEKNNGCNHMSCPCGHHFCWLCFKPAGTQGHYACEGDVYRPATQRKSKESKEEATARQARASLDRYLFHYERWAGNLKSLEKARQDMDKLERSELEEMAAAVGIKAVTELDFVTEAYKEIVYGRRVLRWAHAYGYYLDPERDGKKRELFDYLQGEANSSLELLHKCAEVDRKDIFCSGGDSSKVMKKKVLKDYRIRMVNLTVASRTFMGNLVKAFESNLSEVYTMNF